MREKTSSAGRELIVYLKDKGYSSINSFCKDAQGLGYDNTRCANNLLNFAINGRRGLTTRLYEGIIRHFNQDPTIVQICAKLKEPTINSRENVLEKLTDTYIKEIREYFRDLNTSDKLAKLTRLEKLINELKS